MKNKQSEWAFGARQHKLRQEHSDKPRVWTGDSSSSALFEQTVSRSFFLNWYISYIIVYWWLESNCLMNRWRLIFFILKKKIINKSKSVWWRGGAVLPLTDALNVAWPGNRWRDSQLRVFILTLLDSQTGRSQWIFFL